MSERGSLASLIWRHSPGVLACSLLALSIIGEAKAQDQDDRAKVDMAGPITAQEWAEQCKPWDEWDKPAPPFKIFGDTYYVGTCGITALLVRTDEGHVLIDTGTQAGARIAYTNLSRLDANPRKIGLILYSHEHFDHVGGVYWMQNKTGAPIAASPKAAHVLRTGELDPADPQAGMHENMKPVPHVIEISGEAALTYAGNIFTPIPTPGHSPGALSWQWVNCEDAHCKTFVYADSLSPVSREDYKFSDHPEYVAKYRAGLDRLAALRCDILLTPHPSHSKMVKRAETGSLEGGVSCAEYAATKHRNLDERLAKERGE